MDYELYKAAVEYEKDSPSRAALEPYWECLIEIASSEDPWEAMEDHGVWFEKDARLVLCTGGPHVELTYNGDLRATWGQGWIYSPPWSSDEARAATFFQRLAREIAVSELW